MPGIEQFGHTVGFIVVGVIGFLLLVYIGIKISNAIRNRNLR
jgi:hypothetical protein